MKINLCENEILSKISRYCDTIIQTAEAAMHSEGVDGVVNILFVDSPEIRRLNMEFREIDSVTDVLSFPENELEGPISQYAEKPELDTDPETGEVVLGDIAICLDRASAQAEEYGHSLERELCFLALHGTCHLMGYDHQTAGEEKIMTEKQKNILDQLGIHR